MNEDHNVFRTLAEQPLLVSRFWCRFGMHSWTKWSIPEIKSIAGYKHIVQARACAGCGLYSERKEKQNDF